jgi:hypothetical protein
MGAIQQLAINGQTLPLLGHSAIRRENHGFSWLATTPAHWLRDRFLIFQDDDGLCIVDATKKQILVNQVFAGFTKAPGLEEWAAIRYRPTARNQETLTGFERDTLWVIDPEVLASKSDLASEDAPFRHIPSVQLDGIAIAPPIWTEDGSGVVTAIYRDGYVDAVLFDAASQQETKRVRLDGLSLTAEQVLSPWFLKEVEAAIGSALAATGLVKSSYPEANALPRGTDGNPPQQPSKPEPSQWLSAGEPSELSLLAASPTIQAPFGFPKQKAPVWPWVFGGICALAMIAAFFWRRVFPRQSPRGTLRQ